MVFLRVAALLLAGMAAATAQSPFYLRDGDRVVFYGDSITDQRLYTVFTETFAVTRFPKLNVSFIHSGWGGDRVSGGGGGPIDMRLARDVLAYKPTVVTIMLGMNDAGYKAFDETTYDTYTKGYQHILDSLKSNLPNVRITAIQPSPYDDVTQPVLFEGGYNAVLLRYSQGVKELAGKEHLDVADLNTPVVAALRRAEGLDAAGAKKLIPDRVHPGPAGHLLMAEALLKAWNAPATVSEVEIDLRAHKASKSVNAQVTSIKDNTWTVTETALPMPIDLKDASTKLAIQSSDFLDALDREMLRVSGLSSGKWQLKIDGQAVGVFSNDELAAGVNLARFDTPMMQQAMTVHQYTKKHTDIHNTRWRNVQVPLEKDALPDKEPVMKALDRLESELVREQRQAAIPVAHHYELGAQ